MRNCLSLLLFIIIGSSLILVNFEQLAIVEASGVELFSGGAPYNKSYGDWVAEYWKWWISIPENQSSINHPNRIKCLMHDSGPVIFLLSPTGNFHEQNCTIPTGKALLFTPYTMECDTGLADYHNASRDSLLSCARDSDGGVFLWSGQVDSTKLGKGNMTYSETKEFDIPIPPDNQYRADPGTFKAMALGWFIFLKPLPAGTHTISQNYDIKEISTPFSGQAKYILNVTNP